MNHSIWNQWWEKIETLVLMVKRTSQWINSFIQLIKTKSVATEMPPYGSPAYRISSFGSSITESGSVWEIQDIKTFPCRALCLTAPLWKKTNVWRLSLYLSSICLPAVMELALIENLGRYKFICLLLPWKSYKVAFSSTLHLTHVASGWARLWCCRIFNVLHAQQLP